MTYPPSGGYDPQQPVQPPYQPSDPYRHGQPGYGQPGGYSAPGPPGYPGMTPPVNVQQGYSVPPPGSPYGQSPLPPQPPRQSHSLVITLGVIVGLVLLLGIAALLVVPGLLENGDTNEAGRDRPAAASEEPTGDEDGDDVEVDPEGGDPGGGDEQRGWSDFVAYGEAEAGSPEDVVMRWETAYDLAEPEKMEALVCADPGWMIQSYLELAAERDPYEFSSTYYAASRDVYGERQVALTYTYDEAPSHDDISSGYIVVEEGGEWKVCDSAYF